MRVHETDRQQKNLAVMDTCQGTKALWVAVLARAVLDAFQRDPGPGPQESVIRQERRHARQWLIQLSADLRAVLDNADIEPDTALPAFREPERGGCAIPASACCRMASGADERAAA